MLVADILERAAGALRTIAARLSDGSRQSEDQLTRDNQRYWLDRANAKFEPFSHWRGKGPFEDDELWLGLGRGHLELFDTIAACSGFGSSPSRIVDWGSGGGMNAVHFAPRCREYYGVDISPDSLAECAAQCTTVGAGSFAPILIEADDPEAAVPRISSPVDLFLSTYVFELVPSPEYGLRLMQIAYDLLRSGGMALIQIRYHTGRPDEFPKRRDYDANMAQMTTYALDEFWVACERIGFRPAFIRLLPEQPELSEQRYAYYAMFK